MARVREANRWDAVINSVNYRLKEYRKVSGRSQLEIQQMLNQAGNQFTSRRDLRTLFQTDWSGGAQWQKPLLSDQSIDSYYISEGFDLVTEPGNIFPTAGTYRDSATWDWITYGGRLIQVSPSEIYGIGDDGGGVGDRVIKWDGSSQTYLTNRFATSDVSWKDTCYDAATKTIFALSATEIEYVTIDSAGGSVITHGETLYEGKTIFVHFGRLMLWNGDKLWEIKDPLGTATKTLIYDDGMGPDAIDSITLGTGNQWYQTNSTRLAIGTAEGIWLVKNVSQDGNPTPYITRVDRTNDGTNVGVPVATLPSGSVAVSVAYALGSLLISSTSDLFEAYANNTGLYDYPRIDFYHLTNDSLGSLGNIFGGSSPESAPYLFVGSDGPRIYVSGSGGLWIYDAIRGGFHRLATWSNNETVVNTLVHTTDGSGNSILLTRKPNTAGVSQVVYLADKAESSITHELESNYLDGNLPSELKSLVGITLMTSGIKTNETWTISIEADDGSFTSAATFNTVGAKTTYKALASAITGYRFRYKIAYTASEDITAPSRVKGIVLHMVQGDMVTAWQLTIDGTEIRNIENQKLDADDALAGLETLMEKQVLTTYVDEYRKTSTTHDVRVDSVQVVKDTPNELEAVVVLTEQDLDN